MVSVADVGDKTSANYFPSNVSCTTTCIHGLECPRDGFSMWKKKEKRKKEKER